MATPFKRLCSRAQKAPTPHSNTGVASRPTAEPLPWHPVRTTSSTQQRRAYHASPWRRATADALESNSSAQADLDEAPLPKPSNLSSTAHAELAQHREVRELTRLAAWEMPLLSSLATPFVAPAAATQPLRWRYTTYFGDAHPAARKVVVSFGVGGALAAAAQLDARQQQKLRKLCGARYDPAGDTVRMSCDAFATQAQNKRYLGDVVRALIAECKDPDADLFEDVPLDVRHHKAKPVLRFPERWRVTPERRAELEAARRTRLLEEASRVEEGKVVNGLAAIEEARKMEVNTVEEPVMVQAGKALPKGKMGKKEMGRTRASR